MLVKRSGSTPNVTIVTFRYPSDSYAETVHLVGDFNHWDRASLPFDCCRSNEDYWELVLELPAGGRYQYRFLINEQTWVNDSHADEYAEDAEGNLNSIVMT